MCNYIIHTNNLTFFLTIIFSIDFFISYILIIMIILLIIFLFFFFGWGRRSPFKLGHVYPRFKSLKLGCHLGSKEDLPWSLRGKRQRTVLFPNDSKSEGARKLGTLVQRVTDRYLRQLEEFRIWFSLQIYNKTSKTLNEIKISNA